MFTGAIKQRSGPQALSPLSHEWTKGRLERYCLRQAGVQRMKGWQAPKQGFSLGPNITISLKCYYTKLITWQKVKCTGTPSWPCWTLWLWTGWRTRTTEKCKSGKMRQALCNSRQSSKTLKRVEHGQWLILSLFKNDTQIWN